MSDRGQLRRSDRTPVTSGLPPINGQFPSLSACLKGARNRLMHRSKGERSACIFVTLDRTAAAPCPEGAAALGRSGGRLRDAFDDLEIGRQRLALFELCIQRADK